MSADADGTDAEMTLICERAGTGDFMRYWLPAALLLLPMQNAMSANDTAISSEPATLNWVAGDSLPGALIAADEQTLTWRSPVFADPLKIDIKALSSVAFAKPAEPRPIADSLRVSMLNGDLLFGNLTAVDEKLFHFDSSRHGILQLRRDQIRSLRRLDSPGVVFLGPQGLSGWRHPLFAQWTEPPGWSEISEGQLTTSKAESVIFRPLEFPTRCEIELVISSDALPSFVFSLGSNSETSLRLETWDNALVAMSQNDFVSVDTLADDQRKVHLFLFVDMESRQMTVFSDSGQKLAEIVASDGDFGTSGILLRNGARNLTLEHLSIAKWDGTPFQGVQSEKSRVHTADGKVHYGQIVRVSDDRQSVQVSDGTVESSIQLGEIRALIVKESAASAVPPSDVRLTFTDGESISGSLVGLSDGKVLLKTVHSDEPVSSKLEGAANLQLTGTITPPAEPDRMYFPSGSLQGTLVIDDTSDSPVRWKPLGGLNASSLIADGTARFVRGQKAAQVAVDTNRFPDVLYLTNNDVIPCRLLSCRSDTIRMESPFCQMSEIPAVDVRAIELRQMHEEGRRGFADKGWRRIVGSPQYDAERLVFKASEAIGHTSILAGDVVQFRLSWGQKVAATLTFHMYTQLPGHVPAGTPISFVCRGDTLTILDGSLAEAGRFGRVADPANSVEEISVTQRNAMVTIFRQGDRIRVSVDGQLARTFTAARSENDPKGILIRANIINVNNQAAARNLAAGGFKPQDAADPDKTIEVSEFSVRDVVGGSIRQFIDEDAREATLTIPRFRRDNPPTHVLLAPNGDLLRGRLIDANDDGVEFESRLERFKLPRERVAAVIWLKTPPPSDTVTSSDDTSPAPQKSAQTVTPENKATIAQNQLDSGNDADNDADVAEANRNQVQIVMDRDIFLTMHPKAISNGQLMGTSARLGACSVPAAGIRELTIGHWNTGSQTASYTLWIPKNAADPKWDIPEDSGSSPASQMIGEVAPGFQLPTIDAGLFRLPDHKDKVIVLDFWATWCGPCVQALPAYIDETSKFDPEKVMFVAVNLEETPQTVRAFLKKHSLSPLVLMDRTGIVGAEFNVSGIPHSVIIGPGNVIEHVRIGYRSGTETEMSEIITQILNGTWKRPEKPEQGQPADEPIKVE